MLRKLIFLLLVFGASVGVGAASAQSAVLFKWNPYVLPTGWTTCPATGTKASCVTNMTQTDVTNSAAPVVVGNPAITDTSLSIALPSAGSHTYNLVVNGFNFGGTAVSGPPAVVTVQVPAVLPALIVPSGLTATVQ